MTLSENSTLNPSNWYTASPPFSEAVLLSPWSSSLLKDRVIIASSSLVRLHAQDSSCDGQRETDLFIVDRSDSPGGVHLLDRAQGELEQPERRHHPNHSALRRLALQFDRVHEFSRAVLRDSIRPQSI